MTLLPSFGGGVSTIKWSELWLGEQGVLGEDALEGDLQHALDSTFSLSGTIACFGNDSSNLLLHLDEELGPLLSSVSSFSCSVSSSLFEVEADTTEVDPLVLELHLSGGCGSNKLT